MRHLILHNSGASKKIESFIAKGLVFFFASPPCRLLKFACWEYIEGTSVRC